MQGLGYGLMTSCQNTGQFVVPIILAHVYEWDRSYADCEAIFVITSIISLMFTMILIVYDEFYNDSQLRRVCSNGINEVEESIQPKNSDYDSGDYLA